MSEKDDAPERNGVFGSLESFSEFIGVEEPQDDDIKPQVSDSFFERGERQEKGEPVEAFALPKPAKKATPPKRDRTAPGRPAPQRRASGSYASNRAKPTPKSSNGKKIAAAVAVSALVIGVGGYSLLGGNGEQHQAAKPTTETTLTTIPAKVPAGWSDKATWTSSNNGGSPSVLPNGYVVTKNSNQFTISDPSTGATEYTSNNVNAIPTSAPFGDASNPGYTWDQGNGNGAVWTKKVGYKSFPMSGGSLYVTGGRPFVWNKDSHKASVVSDDGKEATVSINSAFTPMGVLDDGSVVSSDGNSTLRTSRVGSKDKTISMSFPDKLIARRWVGMVSNIIVVILDKKGNPDDERDSVVAFVDASTGKIAASSKAKWKYMKNAVVANDQTFGKIGVGPVYFDGSKAITLSDESVTMISVVSGKPYGIDGSQRVGLVSGTSFAPYQGETAIPIGVSPSGQGIVKVDSNVYAASKA